MILFALSVAVFLGAVGVGFVGDVLFPERGGSAFGAGLFLGLAALIVWAAVS